MLSVVHAVTFAARVAVDPPPDSAAAMASVIMARLPQERLRIQLLPVMPRQVTLMATILSRDSVYSTLQPVQNLRVDLARIGVTEVVELPIGHGGAGQRQGLLRLPCHLHRKHPVAPAVHQIDR